MTDDQPAPMPDSSRPIAMMPYDLWQTKASGFSPGTGRALASVLDMHGRSVCEGLLKEDADFIVKAANAQFDKLPAPAASAERDEIDRLRTAYATGMSADDYRAVQAWIAADMPQPAQTAFTAGPARQAARLLQEAVAERNKEIERFKSFLKGCLAQLERDTELLYEGMPHQEPSIMAEARAFLEEGEQSLPKGMAGDIREGDL